MEDDLLITNKYYDNNIVNYSDNVSFGKLMNSKNLAKSIYSKGNPEFTEEKKIDRDIGLNISEESVGLEQFIKLGMLEKRKKIKKTIINIDSRNRNAYTIYDKVHLTVRKYNEFIYPELNRPIQFKFRKNYGYILLENNEIKSLEQKQIIFLESGDDFTSTGFTNNDFIFNTTVGTPIINVLEYLYDIDISYRNEDGFRYSTPLDSLNQAIYDDNKKAYIFNVIKFEIPNRNLVSSIKETSFGTENTQVELVSNIIVGYSNSSHYRISLGANFSNIYGVRLLSTEIPNTAYTFNATELYSNFGSFNLKTNINNILKWVYKTNNVIMPNLSAISGNILMKNNSVYPSIQAPTSLQLQSLTHQQYINSISTFVDNTGNLKPNIDIKTFINCIERQQSILFNSYSNTSFDNYFDQSYMGSWADINNMEANFNNYYFPNTYNITNEYLHPYLSKIYNTYKYYILNEISDDTNDGPYYETATISIVDGYFKLDISANSNRLDANDNVNYLGNNYYDSRSGYRFDNFVDYMIHNNTTFKYNISPIERISQVPNRIDTIYNSRIQNIIDANPLMIKIVTRPYIDKTLPPVYSAGYVAPQKPNKYSFSVFKITKNTNTYNIDGYSIYMLPMCGDFVDRTIGDNIINNYFTDLIDYINNGSKFILVNCEPLKQDLVIELKNNRGSTYNFMRYVLESQSLLFPCAKYNIYNSSNQLTNSLDNFINFNTDNIGPTDKTKIEHDDSFINISGTSEIYNGNKIVLSFKTIDSLSFTYYNQNSVSNKQFYYDSIAQKLYISLIYYSISFPEIYSKFIEDIINYNYLFSIDTKIFFLFNKYSLENGVLVLDILATNYYVSFTNNTEYILELQNFKNENFYDYDYSNIDSIYFDYQFNQNQTGFLDGKCSIIRIYKDSNIANYVDFYLGSKNSNDFYIVKFKYNSGNLNLLVDTSITLLLIEEKHNYYIRETINDYLLLKFDNIVNTNRKISYIENTRGIISNADRNNANNNIITYLYNADNGDQDVSGKSKLFVAKKNELSNISKTPLYGLVSIYERKGFTDTVENENVIQVGNSEEYIYRTPVDVLVQLPIVDTKTEKIYTPILLTTNYSNSMLPLAGENNGLKIYNYEKHPIYTAKINPGKYTETNLIQFVDKNLNNIVKKDYDYNIEQFIEKDVTSRVQLLKNIYDTGSSKFTIELDRNINYLKLTSFRRVFQTYSNNSSDNKKILFTNENFPYLYFRIPELSIINGGLMKIEGSSSIDNILSTEVNGLKNIIIPKNYRICVRQIMPLPKNPYLDSNKNMFSSRGNPISSTTVNKLYVDYINSAIKSSNIKDININYIVDRIFHFAETNYSNLNKLNSSNISNSSSIYKKTDYIQREHSFYTENLERSYTNANGTNNNYNSNVGYNGSKIYSTTKNEYGLEYQGFSAISGFYNKSLYNENEVTRGTEMYVTGGLETTFLTNELFVNLSDIYGSSTNYNKIGRITNADKYTDNNGNVNLEYDLFAESNKNFKIGDLIIGLDSQSIGIILPYDYNYSNLLNEEVKVLGLGAYILNSEISNSQSFFNIFFSNTNPYFRDQFYNLAKAFIQKVNYWPIVENYNKSGFYIYSKTVPNTSRLTGITGTNLSLYIPEYFKFITKENSPLSQFGLTSDTYFNKYNYFRDNLEPYETSLINNSYIYRYSDVGSMLVFETKQSGNFNINDTIYIEDHSILYTNLDINRSSYLKIDRFEPFSNFITKIEDIYNSLVINYVDKNTVKKNKERLLNIRTIGSTNRFVKETDDYDTLFDYKYSLDSENSKVSIPFKNKFLVRKLDQDIDKYSFNYYLSYTQESPGIDTERSSKLFKIVGTQSNGIFTSISQINILDGNTNSISRNVISSDYIDDTQMYILTIYDSGVINDFTIDTVRYNRYIKPINSSFIFTIDVSGIGEIKELYNYWISIECVRSSYSVNTITAIDNNNVVDKYDTLGIFERLMLNYIQNIYRFFSYNLTKANSINKKYNYNIYKNRIVKLKVSPIDNKGFSYEPTTNGNSASVTNFINRTVAGYCRKLFPYHERQFIKNYYQDSQGEKITALLNNYIGYSRPKQHISNYDYDMKQFLPGMGIYLIDNEKIYNNTNSYSNKFPATIYEYSTTFLGYVLDTSVESKDEYIRDYIHNSNNFSNKSNTNNTTYSEYYIYMLIDPDITSKAGIDSIFDKLNNDYNHIVFDAEADSDNFDIPIEEPGITNAKLKYSYNYTISNNTASFTLKNSTTSINTNNTNDYAFRIDQNIYGHYNYIQSNALTLYENSSLNTNISNTNVDSLSGLFIGNTIIKKHKLNKTLPFYSFQTRKAYATVTLKPVLLSNSDNGSKLFISGDIDYFYKNFIKNKTIMNYTPLMEKQELDYYNITQGIFGNPGISNFKEFNHKEFNCHANYIDNNYNRYNDETDFEFYKTNGYSQDYIDNTSAVRTVRKFEPGDDIVIIDNNKSLSLYKNDKDYNMLDKLQSGILNKNNVFFNSNIKVINGNAFPIVHFPHQNIFSDSIFTNVQNTALLDYDYNLDMQITDRSLFMAKTKGYTLDIVGNNSLSHSIDNESYISDYYNGVKIEKIKDSDLITDNNVDFYTNTVYLFPKYLGGEVSFNNQLATGREIGLGSISGGVLNGADIVTVKHPDISGGLFITYANQYKKNSTLYPGKSPYKSETGIIDYAVYTDLDGNIIDSSRTDILVDGTYQVDWFKVYVKVVFKNYLKYLRKDITDPNSDIYKYNFHCIPYRTLETTSFVNIRYDNFYLINPQTGGPTDPIKLSCIHRNKIDNKYYVAIVDPSGFINKGDYILLDYGVDNYVQDSMDNTVPYLLFNSGGQGIRLGSTMYRYRVNDIIEISNPSFETPIRMFQINTPIVYHRSDTRVIVLKDVVAPFYYESEGGLDQIPNIYYEYYEGSPWSLLATQPFTQKNKWYTRVFYRGSYQPDGGHIDSSGNNKYLIPDFYNYSSKAGQSKLSQFTSKKIYIRGMKGLQIPLDNFSDSKYVKIGNSSISYFESSDKTVEPVPTGYYNTENHVFEDFLNSNIDINVYPIYGAFSDINSEIYNIEKISNITNSSNTWVDSRFDSNLYPFFIIEGLYLGYGGEVLESYDSDDINQTINNDTGYNIKRILKTDDNKQFIFIDLPSYFSYLIKDREDTNIFKNVVGLDRNEILPVFYNHKNRSDTLPITLKNDINDNILNSDPETIENLYEFFGRDGKLVKKKIVSPYNLNPNNYILLCIPNLKHIDTVQNHAIDQAFSKILLPGESNRVLYNTFVGGSKIFYDNLFNNLNELEIAFLTNDGSLFDFNGSEHSFTIEITELIDKFENINPRYGNIEI